VTENGQTPDDPVMEEREVIARVGQRALRSRREPTIKHGANESDIIREGELFGGKGGTWPSRWNKIGNREDEVQRVNSREVSCERKVRRVITSLKPHPPY